MEPHLFLYFTLFQTKGSDLYLCLSKLNLSFVFVFKKQMKSFTLCFVSNENKYIKDHPYFELNWYWFTWKVQEKSLEKKSFYQISNWLSREIYAVRIYKRSGDPSIWFQKRQKSINEGFYYRLIILCISLDETETLKK